MKPVRKLPKQRFRNWGRDCLDRPYVWNNFRYTSYMYDLRFNKGPVKLTFRTPYAYIIYRSWGDLAWLKSYT